MIENTQTLYMLQQHFNIQIEDWHTLNLMNLVKRVEWYYCAPGMDDSLDWKAYDRAVKELDRRGYEIVFLPGKTVDVKTVIRKKRDKALDRAITLHNKRVARFKRVLERDRETWKRYEIAIERHNKGTSTR